MRIEKIGSATLYLADYIDVLPIICTVDVVVTDPPYGVTCNNWDTSIDFTTFWPLVRHSTKENSAVCVFSQQPFTSDLIVSNKKDFRYDLIWIKRKSTGFLNAKKMPLRAHETICIFYATLPTYNPQKFYRATPSYRGPGLRHSTNYGKYADLVATGVKDGSRFPLSFIDVDYEDIFFKQAPYKMHPTQKPVKIMEYLIKTYSNPGEVVLDSFMGCGTTGVAAVRLGRQFVGVEINPVYFDTACRRIEQECDNRALLDMEPDAKRPEQTSLLAAHYQ